MKTKKPKPKSKPDDYGDDPHVAEFPGLTVNDIRTSYRQVTLTVGQKKITKTVPSAIRR